MQQTQEKFFFLALVLVGLYAIYLLSPVLTPFLAAALLAYLGNPLVTGLERCHLPRILSVIIVFVLFFGVVVAFIFLLIPLIEKQISAFIESLPNMIAWVQDSIIPWIKERFNVNEGVVNVDSLKKVLLENYTKAGGTVNWVITTVLSSGYKIITWVMNLLLIPVVTFYLLVDWDKLISGLQKLLPRRIEPTVVALLKECDQLLSAFFRGQVLVMLSLGAIYSIGLSLVGLQIGLLVGLIAGLLSIVPYLGFIVGVVVASIAAFVQFGDFSAVLMVWSVFAFGQVIDNIFLTPKLVGNRIGLHPVAVIFSILAGGSLFGFLGVLLALPVASFIMVWVRYINSQYLKSKLYKEKA